jgi:hypothetical protein
MALISQEMITTVGRAYLKGQLWLDGNNRQTVETVDVALAAETYRYFWKPKPVKTLLLLPRELPTLPADLRLTVRSNWVKIGPHSSPNAFVRTPYCLGFGEPELIPNHPEPQSEKNSAIWTTLAEVVQRDHDTTLPLLNRLEQKVRILHELHRLGIWITHPSLHAGYTDRQLLEIWWQGPGRETHEMTQKPLLIAVGRGLYDDLIACDIPVADFLYHPQGLHSDEQFAHQRATVERVLKFST